MFGCDVCDIRYSMMKVSIIFYLILMKLVITISLSFLKTNISRLLI